MGDLFWGGGGGPITPQWSGSLTGFAKSSQIFQWQDPAICYTISHYLPSYKQGNCKVIEDPGDVVG